MNEQSNRDGQAGSILAGQIPYLRRYARGLTRNATDADDLVQSCLVRALANLHCFERDTNLRAWLRTILHNVFIDGTRKKLRARQAFEATSVAKEGLSQPPNQILHLQVGELERALTRLPDEQKSTLLLVALEDLTYEEAARVTGVPVGTVRSRLSRARRALLNAVEGGGIDGLRDESALIRSTESRRPRVVAESVERPVGDHDGFRRMVA